MQNYFLSEKTFVVFTTSYRLSGNANKPIKNIFGENNVP